ncbi:2677_t:CDS:2 [Diversispora eburnea]|uniref:2677_t:CDS:1 n=1 Tax=Diversispora eburnea TaxID=1213867 RepID=A0A9N9A3A1_9GLOM|nr:2677_t:CDS:2 [Diversispora eburnea]
MLSKNTRKLFTICNLSYNRNPNNLCFSRFNLIKKDWINVRSHIPRVQINVERRRIKPQILKPILFTIFASGASFAVALLYSENRRRNVRHSYWYGLDEYWFNRNKSGFSKTTFEDLNKSKFYKEIQRNWDLLKKQWYSISDGKKTMAILIGINAIVFGMWQLVPLQAFMNKYFVHNPLSVRLITLLTSTFSHREFWHFGFNMIGLYSFGDIGYHILGREQFLAFYLTSGMIASCMSHVISLKFKNWKNIRPSLGASGAIYACLSLVAVEFPEASVVLIFLPFFPIKIIHALPALIAFDIFGIISGKTIFDHWNINIDNFIIGTRSSTNRRGNRFLEWLPFKEFEDVTKIGGINYEGIIKYNSWLEFNKSEKKRLEMVESKKPFVKNPGYEHPNSRYFSRSLNSMLESINSTITGI